MKTSYERTRYSTMSQHHYSYNVQSRRYHRSAHYRDDPIIHELFMSLEQLSSGCTKKMKIAAKVFNEDLDVVRIEEKIVKVTVPAGAKDGTQVIIPSAGNKMPWTIPGDVIFVIRERAHPKFTRDEKNNLIYKVNISLREALIGCDIRMSLPCGEAVNLSTDDVILHGICKRIPGKGMPRGGESRGDLLVKFSVFFPVELSQEQKDGVRSILSGKTARL